MEVSKSCQLAQLPNEMAATAITISTLVPRFEVLTGLSMLAGCTRSMGAKRPLSSEISDEYVRAPAEALAIVALPFCLSYKIAFSAYTPAATGVDGHPLHASFEDSPDGWIVGFLQCLNSRCRLLLGNTTSKLRIISPVRGAVNTKSEAPRRTWPMILGYQY